MLTEFDADELTVHASVALVLLTAEHVLPLLRPRERSHALAENALRVDWEWMETHEADLVKLYWDTMGPLYEDDSRMKDDPLLPVLHCFLFAQLYFFWSADGATRFETGTGIPGLGNDVSESEEAYVNQCLDHAVRVSPDPAATEAWLNGLIEQLLREHPMNDEDPIGRRLGRGEFVVPGVG